MDFKRICTVFGLCVAVVLVVLVVMDKHGFASLFLLFVLTVILRLIGSGNKITTLVLDILNGKIEIKAEDADVQDIHDKAEKEISEDNELSSGMARSGKDRRKIPSGTRQVAAVRKRMKKGALRFFMEQDKDRLISYLINIENAVIGRMERLYSSPFRKKLLISLGSNKRIFLDAITGFDNKEILFEVKTLRSRIGADRFKRIIGTFVRKVESYAEMNSSKDIFGRLVVVLDYCVFDAGYREYLKGVFAKYAKGQRYELVFEDMEDYAESITVAADDAESWSIRGFALGRNGNYKDAIKAYDKAIRINPKYPAAWQNKGKALDKLGRHKEAKEAFGKARKLAG